jgi:hypothetical protein
VAYVLGGNRNLDSDSGFRDNFFSDGNYSDVSCVLELGIGETSRGKVNGLAVYQGNSLLGVAVMDSEQSKELSF